MDRIDSASMSMFFHIGGYVLLFHIGGEASTEIERYFILGDFLIYDLLCCVALAFQAIARECVGHYLHG